MTEMTPQQFLKTPDQWKNRRLIYIVGNDEYGMGRVAARIAEETPGAEYLRFSAATFDRDRLEQAFFSFPIMPGGRILLIDDYKAGALPADSLALFEELFRDIPDFLTVILRNYAEGRFSISKQMERLLDSVPLSVAVEVPKQTGQAAVRTVREMAGREGASMEPDAAERLLELLGEDLMPAENEIKKLAAFADYGTIQREHVERMSVKTAESGVFDMIAALERKDAGRAVALLAGMLRNRTEPLAITASLNTAFINLYRAKMAAGQGKGEAEMFGLFDYKKGDRKVSIAVRRERGYAAAQIEAILELLYRLDIDLKSSPADRGILLEQAVVEIAALCR